MLVEGIEVTLRRSAQGGYDVFVAGQARSIGRVFQARYYMGTRGSGELTFWDAEMPGVPDHLLNMQETRTEAVRTVVRRHLHPR